MPVLEGRDGGVSIETEKILRRDIRKTSKELEPYRAHDPDEISTYVLKECTRPDRPLELLFNKSVKEGPLPED